MRMKNVKKAKDNSVFFLISVIIDEKEFVIPIFRGFWRLFNDKCTEE